MNSIIESWTCQIGADAATFFEAFHEDITATWIHSKIGHRSPGCKPSMGKIGAAFIFTGDVGNLAAISARVYRAGWLTIVIDRYEPVQEDEADLAKWGYATWAEVGRKVTTWLWGYIRDHYNVEPTTQRAGLPSWDDYDETGNQERTEPREMIGTPEDIAAALAPLRDTSGYWAEVERLVRAYWAIHGKRALPISGVKEAWTVEKITGYNRSHIYRNTRLGDKET